MAKIIGRIQKEKKGEEKKPIKGGLKPVDIKLGNNRVLHGHKNLKTGKLTDATQRAVQRALPKSAEGRVSARVEGGKIKLVTGKGTRNGTTGTHGGG